MVMIGQWAAVGEVGGRRQYNCGVLHMGIGMPDSRGGWISLVSGAVVARHLRFMCRNVGRRWMVTAVSVPRCADSGPLMDPHHVSHCRERMRVVDAVEQQNQAQEDS